MTGLPKSIIKKYGVTKKAWQVFRSGASTSGRTSRRVGGNVAKKKSRSRSRSGGSMEVKNAVIGGAIYGAGVAGLQQFAPSMNTPLLRAGAGYLAMKASQPEVRAAGFIALGSEVGRFTAPLAQGLVQGISGGISGSTSGGPTW